jgi:hypothetical protein
MDYLTEARVRVAARLLEKHDFGEKTAEAVPNSSEGWTQSPDNRHTLEHDLGGTESKNLSCIFRVTFAPDTSVALLAWASENGRVIGRACDLDDDVVNPTNEDDQAITKERLVERIRSLRALARAAENLGPQETPAAMRHYAAGAAGRTSSVLSRSAKLASRLNAVTETRPGETREDAILRAAEGLSSVGQLVTEVTMALAAEASRAAAAEAALHEAKGLLRAFIDADSIDPETGPYMHFDWLDEAYAAVRARGWSYLIAPNGTWPGNKEAGQ